jgi:DNA-binding transcriptional MerR regulator
VRPPGFRAVDLDLDALIDTVDRDGHRWSVHPSGWQHPMISGAEGEPVPPPTPPAPAQPPAPAPTDTVSKAEAQRLADQAKKDAEKALLAQFGENVTAEQIKKILDDRKAAEDAKKDEATRAREAADQEKAAALAEKDQAASERLAARVERALVRAGVGAGEEDDEKVDGLIARARGALGVLPSDSDDTAIKAAVTKLKEDVPGFFGPMERKTGPGAPPPPAPRNSGGTKNAEEERKARLEAIAARTGIR